MRPEPLSDLADLLEEERRAIRSGDWGALGALARRKEVGLASFADDAPALALLAGGLARNQALLAAALDGVREVGRRRAALASSRAGLVTYDARGTRAELPLAPPKVERRA